MPRNIRLSALNSRHHIMLRGVAGQNIFNDDKDRIRLCFILQEASEKHKFIIHAFCFMRNHLHFVFEPTESSLQECVHCFAFRYAQYYNRRQKRRGYLFQGRFKSILVDDGMYLKYLIKYIHRNPIEAHITNELEEYRWCSHRAYLGLDEYTWLTTDEVLSRFSHSRAEAKQRLKDFVEMKPERCEDSMDISKALSQGVYGSSDFIQKFNPMLIGNSQEKQTTKAISLQEALSQICNKFQVDLSALSSPYKYKHFVDARSVLALLGRIGQQEWNLQDVADLLNKNHGSISRLASRAKNNPELLNFVNILLSN